MYNNFVSNEKLIHLFDNLYDEICICDNSSRIIYVNKACQRHYGFSPEEMIGQAFEDFEMIKWWDRSVLPHVYKDKKPYAIKQKSDIGVNLLTIAIPILDKNEDIEYVIMSVRDEINDKLLLSSQEKDIVIKSHQNKVELLYESENMHRVVKNIERVSNIDASCLLLGETGTGKTLLAKYMHSISNRKDNPFVSINCATLQKELMASELFGYTKGSFTGAKSEGKKGLFEIANGGTILLDEIGEIPFDIQAKLLHVLQDKEYLPIGGSNPIKVDVKIIAATNKSIPKMIANGNFREDLFYRLNIFEINVPPLRERKEDIVKLSSYFLHKLDKKYEQSHIISPEAMKVICDYEWKGNIRELRHVIERLTVMIDDMIILPQHLPKQLFSIPTTPVKTIIDSEIEKLDFDEAIETLEKKLITKSYQKCKTTRNVAADLNISQTRASKLIRKYIKINNKIEPT